MSIAVVVLISGLVVVPGARLAVLARRSHQRPEALLSAFFLLIGIAAFLRLLNVAILQPAEQGSPVLGLAGHVIMSLGLLAVVGFTREVFRPSTRWANWLTGLLCALIFASCAVFLVPGSDGDEASRASFFANGVRALPFFWLFAEAVCQYAKMRRQAHLGIADPIVTNRFLLWSVWTGMLAFIPIVLICFRTASLVASTNSTGQELIAAKLQLLAYLRIVLVVWGSGTAASVSLSFFPPQRYLRWIEARALSQAQGS